MQLLSVIIFIQLIEFSTQIPEYHFKNQTDLPLRLVPISTGAIKGSRCYDWSFLTLTDELRNRIEYYHNEQRNKFAASNILGSAKDMMELHYIKRIEFFAYQASKACLENSNAILMDNNDDAIGYNIYLYSGKYKAEKLIDEAMKFWFSPVDIPVETYNEYTPNENWRFFTQVMWADTKEIGCSGLINPSRTKVTFYCLYHPTGNIRGRSVFSHQAHYECDKSIRFPNLCKPLKFFSDSKGNILYINLFLTTLLILFAYLSQN